MEEKQNISEGNNQEGEKNSNGFIQDLNDAIRKAPARARLRRIVRDQMMEKIGLKKRTDINAILGEIGCKFRSNIESHIKDYRLQKCDDVEWLLEPLSEISHPDNYVLDAYQISTRWETIYELYFHIKGATSIYVPFDNQLKEPCRIQNEGNTISFDHVDEEDLPKPKPFDKSMIIKEHIPPLASKAIPSIWDEMVVPFTTVGIWQAVLLHQTLTLFPKGWHANYMKSIYVYSLEDMQTIIKQHKRDSYGFDHEKLASYLNRDDIMPSVKIDGDKAIAAYYYWNDWSGFCRRIIPVKKHGNTIKFGEFEREKLVEYDCGIRY